ncbi:branched-chain amino acid aminotransferase [Robiginitomaculum antarcticum]|uniref:branched-chain amino acid aminotransferase n=1 Tax=Robiginitomaculum antarcticum TaxID=437507 RepID=UPI00036B3063|nr:branched-chain amino acid aminotransferase [Robiginitomaculum antarcticum]
MADRPFHDRDGYIWMDGEFVEWREAKVHVLTHALHYGSAVFEGDRAYDGEIFALDDHSQRLVNSANLLDFKIPYSVEEINKACTDTLSKSGLSSAYVRPFAWRGSEKMGVSAKGNTIHFSVAVWAWGNYFADKMKGIRLTIAKWKRPSPDTIPCKSKAAGLYMICTMSKHAAEADGYDDALMMDYRGYVAECTGAHIFFIRDGELHTPTNDILLDGITYKTIIALAEKRGIKVNRRNIMPDEIKTFTGCFIVGTAAEVTPVREIKGHEMQVGDMILQMAQDYDDLVHRRISL